MHLASEAPHSTIYIVSKAEKTAQNKTCYWLCIYDPTDPSILAKSFPEQPTVAAVYSRHTRVHLTACNSTHLSSVCRALLRMWDDCSSTTESRFMLRKPCGRLNLHLQREAERVPSRKVDFGCKKSAITFCSSVLKPHSWLKCCQNHNMNCSNYKIVGGEGEMCENTILN